ncbi:glycosyl transferase GTA-type super family [Candidatus Termititenax aidoneus]|uniref:Glycosyl transferase GTA-type super family n=1 Tax=Termititenax aidoneus TaxID=2218524 RepID=A0A388TBQ6_TERA1|nr:glycosyl transferase GTA-type super family [Candidatus Termititenax aidoneus]
MGGLTMPKFSIITVCRNAERDIGRTINSVLGQDFPDYEYIIIDGASTDNTIFIVKQYGKKITKFISEPDTGIYQAMNKGIKWAAGDLLLHECILGIMAKQIEQNSAEILYGDIVKVDLTKGDTLYFSSTKYLHKFYLYQKIIFHQTAFIKKQAFKKVGLYDESFSLAGDHEWFLRALTKYKCGYFYYDYCAVLFSAGGISSGGLKNEKLQQEIRLIKNKYYTWLERLFCSCDLFYAVWAFLYKIWWKYNAKN